MSKVIFLPVSIGGGLLAGLFSTKLFGVIWGVIDNQEPPSAEHREVSLPKLVAALLIEGALFSVIKGLVDHGSRHAFARFTGTWPGQERPESE